MAVASTRIDADALFVASKVDCAVIVAVPGATAVTNPVAFTVAIAFDELVHVTVVAAPPTAVTVAVSCDVVPTISAGSGEFTVTDCTAGCGVTVSATDPALVLSNDEVAVMVAFPGETPVTTPLADTVATALFELDQATAADAPLTTTTFTPSASVFPTTRVVDGAFTVTEVTAGGGGMMVTCTVADLVGSKVDVAVMVAVPTATPVTTPAVLTDAMV